MFYDSHVIVRLCNRLNVWRRTKSRPTAQSKNIFFAEWEKRFIFATENSMSQMTQADKLILKLMSKPKDLTFTELTKIFNHFGFKIENKGNTSGARVEFYSDTLNLSFYTHKPHPDSNVKIYVIIDVIKFFKSIDLL